MAFEFYLYFRWYLCKNLEGKNYEVHLQLFFSSIQWNVTVQNIANQHTGTVSNYPITVNLANGRTKKAGNFFKRLTVSFHEVEAFSVKNIGLFLVTDWAEIKLRVSYENLTSCSYELLYHRAQSWLLGGFCSGCRRQRLLHMWYLRPWTR